VTIHLSILVLSSSNDLSHTVTLVTVMYVEVLLSKDFSQFEATQRHRIYSRSGLERTRDC
jgi:hypothetical protein